MPPQPFDQCVLDLLLHRWPPEQACCVPPVALAESLGGSASAVRLVIGLLAHKGLVQAESCLCEAETHAHLRIRVTPGVPLLPVPRARRPDRSNAGRRLPVLGDQRQEAGSDRGGILTR